jgi:hypothetical protein
MGQWKVVENKELLLEITEVVADKFQLDLIHCLICLIKYKVLHQYQTCAIKYIIPECFRFTAPRKLYSQPSFPLNCDNSTKNNGVLEGKEERN